MDRGGGRKWAGQEKGSTEGVHRKKKILGSTRDAHSGEDPPSAAAGEQLSPRTGEIALLSSATSR